MISIVRLIDGTEVVGVVSAEQDGHIFIQDPMQINYRVRTDSAMPVVSMIRFMPFSKEHKIKVRKEHIITSTTPMVGLESYYTSMVKSIKEVDDSVNQEFLNAAKEELTEEMQVKMAMMEKLSSKATLN